MMLFYLLAGEKRKKNKKRKKKDSQPLNRGSQSFPFPAGKGTAVTPSAKERGYHGVKRLDFLGKAQKQTARLIEKGCREKKKRESLRLMIEN
jgi:hypothetical protein